MDTSEQPPSSGINESWENSRNPDDRRNFRGYGTSHHGGRGRGASGPGQGQRSRGRGRGGGAGGYDSRPDRRGDGEVTGRGGRRGEGKYDSQRGRGRGGQFRDGPSRADQNRRGENDFDNDSNSSASYRASNNYSDSSNHGQSQYSDGSWRGRHRQHHGRGAGRQQQMGGRGGRLTERRDRESSRESYDGRRGSGRVASETRLNPNAPPFEPSGSSLALDDKSLREVNGSSEPEADRNAGFENNGHRRRKENERWKEEKTRNPRGYRHQEQSPTENDAHDYGEKKSRETVQSRNKPRNQREVLMDQLSRNAYECMVCCEKVRYSHPIWSCKRCFNVFHLSCIRKWAASSKDESGWRCPGCQSYYEVCPEGYYCFCGKTKFPKTSRYDIPHTCGQTCGKSHPGGLNCTHSCDSPCHPGPCPSCEVQQTRYCGCGKTNAQVLCGSKTILNCQNTCNKKLNCGVHQCIRLCHSGECLPCEEKIIHECYCKCERKEVSCTKDTNLNKLYSCSQVCNAPLSCKIHRCDKICHPGLCGPCKTSTEVVISCPCGQTPISEACMIARMPKRNKCTDPVPTCGKTCLRILPCGDTDKRHQCQSKCHLEKECPPCKLISSVKCRCGNKVLDIPCKELRTLEEVTCQKKCNKKRSCGKHKCNLKCCIDLDHICPIVCQRQLRCGIHTCTNLCHLNPCPPCGIVSFDELSCECGASIIYPPIPCGTRRPPCQLPCSRQHSCEHPVHHPCHSEPNCPPCTVLTEKWCHGKHELRKNVMCHITEISCGLRCSKRLYCKRHICPKTCHPGACLKDGEICTLPCDKLRNCEHKCGHQCHEGDCPDSKCKVMADVNCPCARRNDKLICWKREIEYDRTVTWEYHKELKKLEEEAKAKGETCGINDKVKSEIMEKTKERFPKSMVLECDKECAKVERNRKLAEALQLESADVTTSIGTPNYSEFLTKFAKKNPQFIEMIHKQLADLVLKAKQSRKKNETYAFSSMNRDKRHVIHEYSDHFGVLSESFDEEPNRNVVCFASKEKSYLPSVTLVDAVFRPTVRSERLKPYDDVTFRPEARSQIVRPSSWNMKAVQSSTQSNMVTLGASSETNPNAGATDFPPL